MDALFHAYKWPQLHPYNSVEAAALQSKFLNSSNLECHALGSVGFPGGICLSNIVCNALGNPKRVQRSSPWIFFTVKFVSVKYYNV